MEEISVKGEDYVKASVIAKKFGYTADYIGQLCRADQVKATLVGRSWYVNEQSLLEHKKGRYRSSLTKSKEAIQKTIGENKTQTQSLDPRYLKHLVRYDPDDQELFPTVPGKEAEEVKSDHNNTPKNIATLPETNNIDSIPSPISHTVSIRKFTPVLRTIPALRPLPLRIVEEPRARRAEIVQRRRAFPQVALIVAVVLIGEALMMSAFFGLEKKLVTTTDGTEVVLYNFNPAHISNSASVIFAQIR